VRALQDTRTALDTFPIILNNTFIQQLKGQLSELQRQSAQMGDKLGARHPEMVKLNTAIQSTEARLGAEIEKVVQALRNDFLAARSNEQSLQASLDQQRREAQSLNRAGIQYGALQRDAQSNRELFQGLLQRTRETDLASELKANNIRIVDAAEVSRRPTSPNRRNNLLLGLLGGALFGLCLTFFFEYIDSRIKAPDEIQQHLGIPFMGIVPEAAQPPTGPNGLLLTNQVPNVFSEAFRAVRTSLLFASAEESSKTVLITSTGPGEGKTLVAANLALAMAQSGLRVLLIDSDMRRPQVHNSFRINPEPGLSNVLVGDAKASDAVRRTGVSNLWILTAGKVPPNPAELVGSRRFRDFLTGLSGHFDWILIDSPPVLAVTDSTVIAHYATGVIFVVGADRTSRRTARTAVDVLDRAQATFFGAVLNRVDLVKQSYYYSDFYKREYAEYYARGENKKA
jgi:succinoglycan biosynthesis transport protein ExoP